MGTVLKLLKTRIHSSRMRTVLPGGVVCIGGLPMGVCLPRGGVGRILNTRL